MTQDELWHDRPATSRLEVLPSQIGHSGLMTHGRVAPRHPQVSPDALSRTPPTTTTTTKGDPRMHGDIKLPEDRNQRVLTERLRPAQNRRRTPLNLPVPSLPGGRSVEVARQPSPVLALRWTRS